MSKWGIEEKETIEVLDKSGFCDRHFKIRL